MKDDALGLTHTPSRKRAMRTEESRIAYLPGNVRAGKRDVLIVHGRQTMEIRSTPKSKEDRLGDEVGSTEILPCVQQ
jgi:hypothetical protein